MTATDPPIPNGPAWAAVLAAAIGCAAFGLLVDLAEASKSLSAHLNFYSPAGDLSGKSTVAVLVWLAAWIVLHVCWKKRSLHRTGWIMFISALLILGSIVATCPPFIDLFAPR